MNEKTGILLGMILELLQTKWLSCLII